MTLLDQKIAIITGAASGFGKGIAERYAKEGALVVIGDINYEGAQNTAADIGPNALAVSCDVTSREDIENIVSECINKFGVPDIVVNNAGIVHKNQPLVNVEEEVFDQIFAGNVKSIFHMVKVVAPIMCERGSGAIINIGSTAGIRPRPGLTWYNSSKGAVNLMSKSLAVELGPEGIRVRNILTGKGLTGST